MILNSYNEILALKLESRQLNNSGYSLRAFARDLDISPSMLSSIISGKRKISKNLALELSKKLKLEGEEKEKFLIQYKLNEAFVTKKSYRILSENEYKKISSWHCYAILNLIKCDDFVSNSSLIASRLGLSLEEVDKALYDLEDVGVIQISSEGEITRSVGQVTSTQNIPSISLRDSHKSSLDLAREKIDVVPVDKRSYQMVTMAIDPTKIPIAHDMIDKFLEGLSEIMEGGSKTEVYRFNCQLFPLTKLNDSDSKVVQ